jgi:hypothetical protein
VDVADIPVSIVVGHVEGRQVARGSEVGDARWWGRHATPQPEHMPTRWCPGFAGRRHCDGDKTLVFAADNQGPQNNRLPVCWIGRRLYGARLLFFVSARTNKRHHHHQAQELAVDTTRSRNARLQESRIPVAVVSVTIFADLVGRCRS